MDNSNKINVAADLEAYYVAVTDDAGVTMELTIPTRVFEITDGELVGNGSMVAAWLARCAKMLSLCRYRLSREKSAVEVLTSRLMVDSNAGSEWKAKAIAHASPEYEAAMARLAKAEETYVLLERLFESLIRKAREIEARLFNISAERRVSGLIGRGEEKGGASVEEYIE